MLRNRLLGTAICVAFIAALPIAPFIATAQTGIEVPEMAACESLISDFVANEGIPGLSFALAREGRIVYSRGEVGMVFEQVSGTEDRVAEI
jgi:CubicO group peptidase (beta-lactamase class C family)